MLQAWYLGCRNVSPSLVDISSDKTVRDHVDSVVDNVDSDLLIDTAAFHDIDACETKRDTAWTVNA